MLNRSAFTLIELVVVLAIIAIVATTMIPSFIGQAPYYERKAFIGKLNSLVLFARQNAIITNKIHKVNFDLNKNEIQVLSQSQAEGAKDEEYNLVQSDYIPTQLPIPESLQIKNVYLDGTGVDELNRSQGVKVTGVYFYVVPEGLAQEAIINMIDTSDMIDGKPRMIGLVLNPFSAQFKEYDTFQK
jgi:prepilin-type N-terminal cleavage/methylation domain-containing protein